MILTHDDKGNITGTQTFPTSADFSTKEEWDSYLSAANCVEVPDGTSYSNMKVDLASGSLVAFTASELAAALSSSIAAKKAEIRAGFFTTINTGFSYTFPDGTAGHVQVGDLDRVNIVALVTKATADSTTTISFRDKENRIHPLTSSEMITMGNAALTYVSDQYAKKWSLEDSADKAASQADLDKIIWS